MWKLVVTSSNNNLLLKICCKNIVKILWQYFSIRIFYFLYYFSSFHFIFIPTRFISFFSFFFFLFFSSTQVSNPPSFIHLKNIPASHICFTSEREGESSSAAPPPVEIEVAKRTKSVEFGVHHVALPRPAPHRHSSSSPPPGWVRSACYLFIFSYLLVLIQLYFKNWILFCVLCLD